MGLQERSHGRKSGEGWRLTIGNGSQDLIFKVKRSQILARSIVLNPDPFRQAVNALVNPGDSVLVESPVYA